MDVSVIIPSYKDPCLHKTIDSILNSFQTEFEIIPVIDGYKLGKISKDPRVKPIYLKENGGMRNAINTGVKNSTGKYLIRSDEHVMFAPGFDKRIIEMQDNWIVDATRYFLDPVNWEVMDLPPINHEKMEISKTHNKFTAVKWKSRDREMVDVRIAPKMAMQGSVWAMSRSWWDKVIVELDSEGYGTHYQDSTEMIFKTWQAGGQLMLNKNTWYAHKHRSFNRTHDYPGELARKSWQHAIDTWGEYYKQVVKPTWQI